MSYYSQDWKGFVEVQQPGSNDWFVATEVGSVEQGLAEVKRLGEEVTDLEWRIVDRGGNVYESGRIATLVVESIESIALRMGRGIHIGEGERRRLLEQALSSEEEVA